MTSKVEKKALEISGQKLIYPPDERISAIVASSFPELGRLAALRFLEWVLDNPDGVISLPTGKTPEYFIKEVRRFLEGWESGPVQEELRAWGIDARSKPSMKSLKFVQIDEFYPINPLQHNSFHFYVNKYYINGLGLDPKKSLLINCNEIGLDDGKSLEDVWDGGTVDLSLRYRHPRDAREETQKNVIEKIDQWCDGYEARIRELGGIGFFLGGIGPDGHIGFNVRGSCLFSTTRLARTNYETQAAAAQDLGGIEVARKSLVITIGLDTITFNRSCVAIIMAAGEAKARIVADSIQNDIHVHYPATVLQKLKRSRFYLTSGAAKDLVQRRRALLRSKKTLSPEDEERIVIDLALKNNCPIARLTENHFRQGFGSFVKLEGGLAELKRRIAGSLKARLESGMLPRKNTVFLHTEPHHDDIMLGYLPGVVRNIREHSNSHFFATLTSGFTAVTNDYMLGLLLDLKKHLETGFENLGEGYFNSDNAEKRNRDVWQYLDGVAADLEPIMKEGRLRRLLRDLMVVYDETDFEQLGDRIDELINYFETQYPGRKDLAHIQRLKGMCREWESDCLWGYFGWHSDSVYHLRLGFYTGGIFNEEPTVERDVEPVLGLLQRTNPDVVSVALDPEGSGPDTHYKVLQTLTRALGDYEKQSGKKDIEIWGYRNVWYRFHPAEADIFIPVSLNMFALQDNAFRNSYISQREASFPSYDYDGPFSGLAQKVQVEQYQMLKTCLGREFFNEHTSALIRATRGMVFIKSMGLEDLYRYSRDLSMRIGGYADSS